MLSVILQFHHNILSAQCYLRYVGDSNSINTIQVECCSSELQLLLLMNDEIVKKVKIVSPNVFFIPPSLSSDSNSSEKSGSTVVCRTIVSPAGQSVAEGSFRLQISGADKLDLSESELKVDVKDFFKERFKNGAHWNLCCANCEVGLPLKPMFIKHVQEYSESELSEGWFCHGNGPQPAFQPSTQIIYIDDTFFYLYPRSDLDINSKTTTVLEEKCCSYHDTNCQNDGCICFLSTDCPNVSHGNLSGISCLSESADDCCDSKNIDQFISQSHCDTDCQEDVSVQSRSCLTVSHSDLSDVSCTSKSECSAANKNQCLNGSKVLNPVIECHSCGNVLTSEKPSIPFIRFYLDKLMFKNSSVNDDHLEYARKIALLSFWSLVTKSQTSQLPSKLFLQSKVHGEELCLLLWIPSTPLSQFLLRDSLENIPPEIKIKMEPVYKVLYFIGTSHSENVRSWRHDFSVDFYHVSDTMVKTLIGILDASSSYLPKTSNAGGFSCGFLRTPSQFLS